jgi:hypothetical protein
MWSKALQRREHLTYNVPAFLSVCKRTTPSASAVTACYLTPEGWQSLFASGVFINKKKQRKCTLIMGVTAEIHGNIG